MNTSEYPSCFYQLSAILTGYPETTLHGTGCGEQYFDKLKAVMGEPMLGDLLQGFANLLQEAATCDQLPEVLVKESMLPDPQWGPICKNIIKMWFMGNWYPMPPAWRANYVNSPEDQMEILSNQSYIEGLVWKALGSHPKSAKQPGYGTWASPPFS